jgi:hypothetical protein
MNKILRTFAVFLALSYTPLHAQSWFDWQLAYDYAPEKWIGPYPKNIENFQTAQIKNWSNNDWKDSIRLMQSYYAPSMPKTLLKSVFYQGQWHSEYHRDFIFDAQNRWVRMVERDSINPYSIQYNRWDTAGRLQTVVTEEYNLLGWGWQLKSLDSNIYAPSGLNTHLYNFRWNISQRFWELWYKDSFLYDANRRLTSILSDFWVWNTPHLDWRAVLDYTPTGALNFLRTDNPMRVNGTVVTPFAWDTAFLKINYTYNAQNQLIQMIVEGKDVTDNSSPIRIRYRFTLNSEGKVLEEIKDMFYIYRPPVWINLTKTIYTYSQTRTEELLDENILTVSPNPVRGGQVRIALQDANYRIQGVELYDLYGRNILNQKIDNQQVIDLNLTSIDKRQYLLKVKTDKGSISKMVWILN